MFAADLEVGSIERTRTRIDERPGKDQKLAPTAKLQVSGKVSCIPSMQRDSSERCKGSAAGWRSGVSNASCQCYIHELHDDIILLLLSYLGSPVHGFMLLSILSRRMRCAVLDDRVWKQAFSSRFEGKLCPPTLWRYRCAEAAPLRPVLPLWSYLSPGVSKENGTERFDNSHLGSGTGSLQSMYSPLSSSAPSAYSMVGKGISDSGNSHSLPELFPKQSPQEYACSPIGGKSPSATSSETRDACHYRSSGHTQFSRRAENILSAALADAGVPLGGRCWRGKYFLKHSIEQKFIKGQFEFQRTWFLGSMTEGFLENGDKSLKCGSCRALKSLYGIGKLQGRVSEKSLGLYGGRYDAHQYHHKQLCHRNLKLFYNRLRPYEAVRHQSTKGRSPAVANYVAGIPPESCVIPAVCVVSLKFFCDGTGLVYAARAGGIGACCPDRGYRLCCFSLDPASTESEGKRAVPLLRERSGVAAEMSGATDQEKNSSRQPRGAMKISERSDFQAVRIKQHLPSLNGELIADDVAGIDGQAATHTSYVAHSSLVREQTRASSSGPQLAVCVTHTVDEAFCSDCQPLVIGGFSDGKVAIWDYRRPEQVMSCHSASSLQNRRPPAVKSLCVIPNGSTAYNMGCDILAGTEDGELVLLNIERANGATSQRIRGHTAAIQSIAFHGDKGLILTASRDRYVHIFDIRAGRAPVASCGRHHDWAMCVQVRNGSDVHTFDTADRAVYTWDIRQLLSSAPEGGHQLSRAKPLLERHQHRRLISGLRADALRLVSCSLDGCVLLSSAEKLCSRGLQNDGKITTAKISSTDCAMLGCGKGSQWLLGVDFAETKMATASVDGRVQIYHLLHLPSLPECCLYN